MEAVTNWQGAARTSLKKKKNLPSQRLWEMISCCSFNCGFSPEMFCFPLLYLLPFGEITILLKMLFGKKKILCVIFKDCCWIGFLFWFLIYLSMKWQWFTHYGQICFWRGNISTPKLGSPAFCLYIYNPLEQLISAIVLRCELPCVPSSGSQRACSTIVLVMPCPWWPHTLFFLCICRFLQSVWGLLTGQKIFAELEAL